MNLGIDHYKQPRLDDSRMRIRRPSKPDAYDQLWGEFMDCLRRRDFERAEALRDQLAEATAQLCRDVEREAEREAINAAD